MGAWRGWVYVSGSFRRGQARERTPVNRIGHFSVGFFGFGIAEYLIVRKRMSVAMACLFALFAISFVAMSYELIEWVYAAYGGDAEAGADFLGSQGDIWDAQKDMLMDTMGAVASLLLYLVLRRQSRMVHEHTEQVDEALSRS